MLASRRRLIALGAAAAVVALLPTAAPSKPLRAAKEILYELDVTATNASGTYRSKEWVLAFSGMWRIEEGQRIYLYTNIIGTTGSGRDRSYASFEPDTGWTVRTGSEAFLGSLPERSLTRAAVRSYATGKAAESGIQVTKRTDGSTELRFRNRGFDIVAVLAEGDPFHTERAVDLLRIPAEKITSSTTERTPGSTPLLQRRAYWFGMQLGRRNLVTVVEHMQRRPENRFVFTLFYELPSAGNRTSALPGQSPPAGEIQVASQPRGSAPVQRMLRTLNGNGGRFAVKLRNGEKVTVVRGPRGADIQSFSVVTKKTFVTVSGSFQAKDIPALAGKLKPLL